MNFNLTAWWHRIRGYHRDARPTINPNGFLVQMCSCGESKFTDYKKSQALIAFNPEWAAEREKGTR